MASHPSYSISPAQNGAAFAQDLNSCIAALVTNSSSPTEPATPFAHMLWVDTTAGQIKQRNASNNGWIVIGTLGVTGWGLQNPIGSILVYAGSTAPANYLLCQGQAISRTTYAALFTIIGTTYGVGDGSTTFNLPNLRGRVPLGAGASAASGTNRSLGATGGADTHVLTVSEMPSHNHSGSTATQQLTVRIADGTGNNAATVARGGAFVESNAGVINPNPHAHTISSQGGSNAHNNLQPFVALHYIIRAL